MGTLNGHCNFVLFFWYYVLHHWWARLTKIQQSSMDSLENCFVVLPRPAPPRAAPPVRPGRDVRLSHPPSPAPSFPSRLASVATFVLRCRIYDHAMHVDMIRSLWYTCNRAVIQELCDSAMLNRVCASFDPHQLKTLFNTLALQIITNTMACCYLSRHMLQIY